jgi:cytochrome P450
MRLTLAEADIGGVKVPQGSMVLVLLGSANRDESQIDEPELFRIARGTKAGLAFGNGVHFCLGASLARLEARVAIEELVARFRGFERLPGELEWNVAVTVRGPVALPIRVLPA